MKQLTMIQASQVCGATLDSKQVSTLIGTGIMFFGDALMATAFMHFGIPTDRMLVSKVLVPVFKLGLMYVGYETANYYLAEEEAA